MAMFSLGTRLPPALKSKLTDLIFWGREGGVDL